MKKLTYIVFTIALAAASFALAQNAGGPNAGGKKGGGPPSNAHVLSRAEIDALFAKPDQVLIVDVRRPDEVTAIGGFPVYLSVQIADLEKSLAWIPKDRTLIALSNHAARGKRAADILSKAGFKVAGAAGVEDYESQGGTVLKLAPPPNPAAKK